MKAIRHVWPIAGLRQTNMANFIDVQSLKGTFGKGATSTEPKAMISKSGQLMLNTYVSKAFGATGKTKSLMVGVSWDEKTRKFSVLNNNVKEIPNAFEIRNLGYKSKEQIAEGKKSGAGQLMAGLSGVWMNPGVGILYDYKASGNQSFTMTEVPVSRKDTTLWGYCFEIPEGVHPDAEDEDEKPKKAKATKIAVVAKPADDDEDEDEDEDEEDDDDDEAEEDDDDDDDDDEDDDEDEPEPVPAKKKSGGKKPVAVAKRKGKK